VALQEVIDDPAIIQGFIRTNGTMLYSPDPSLFELFHAVHLDYVTFTFKGIK